MLKAIFHAVALWWAATCASYDTESVEDWEARQF